MYKQMSSVLNSTRQIDSRNALYINVAPIQSTIYKDLGTTTDGTTRAAWVDSVTALSTAGQVVLRDMGKTVYLPTPQTTDGTNPSGTAGYVSSVFRKVQYIPTGGVGTGYSATDSTFFTGYIRLGGVTYGGGSGVPTGVARLG